MLVAGVHDLEDVQEHIDDVEVQHDGGHDVAVFIDLELLVARVSTADNELGVVEEVESKENNTDAGDEVVELWGEQGNENTTNHEDLSDHEAAWAKHCKVTLRKASIKHNG